MKQAEILLYSDSVQNADMLYFGGVFVPDPFIAFSHQGARVAVVGDLEYARVKRESRFDVVESLNDLMPRAKEAFPRVKVTPDAVIALIAKERKISTFRVPHDFPFGTAQSLQQLGLKLDPIDGQPFPEREFKSDEEAAQIRAGNDAASAGFRAVEKLLREATIRRGYLYEGKRRLTSERLREVIMMACVARGALPADTIAACGDRACDPHERGHGPIRANAFIIVDIFPRVMASGYHGDMTRTYLKGQASDAQRALYHAVFEAQQWAIGEHRVRKSGIKIYQAVCERFQQAGYETTRKAGVPVGFFHGLGHGLGLAVHEPPRVNAHGSALRNGQVITVEPGLYYPGIGGVRVEDVIRVTPAGPELLSFHPYRWHIR